jgi:hypothetical protein
MGGGIKLRPYAGRIATSTTGFAIRKAAERNLGLKESLMIGLLPSVNDNR